MIRELVPTNLKVAVHVLKNTVLDLLNGYAFSFAKRRHEDTPRINVFSITQDLKSNEFKKRNIIIARSFIEQITIFPNEIFSFWRVVGKPTTAKGFVKSRSLINGKTIESTGGGLCQLSGLIYLASIHCGFEILERHNHSVDIYDEKTRYMPLGGDATVAFGYKDLKIRNNLRKPICFQINVEDDSVTVNVKYPEAININQVEFIIANQNDSIKVVDTMINNKKALTSVYQNHKIELNAS
ncbi:VanW family protein [Aureibacter tunicatorum]|uniref:Vancomycin resistance protein VanW n=1 Tax=Aureibacter tunicatorum TaxID=866807 RepID=A0AAE3XKE9_9BACT|nr:VanW family protein [Aureibacter tunicatorum]MDR6238517.1 vancomycin resistance protein VanW [Aureibacter tunicatorum]BDD05550.1 hypothetical protein AUTU_30330 [Aureibacter tunicatorum]